MAGMDFDLIDYNVTISASAPRPGVIFRDDVLVLDPEANMQDSSLKLLFP